MSSSESIAWGNDALSSVDAEVAGLVEAEKERQGTGLCLIASENFTSRAVMEAVGSSFCNKYAEGYPGKRYYGGAEVCDRLETLCQRRALAAFKLTSGGPEGESAEWGVNVQVYSGSAANWCVYDALLQPHDRLMGLDLSAGGHLSHGYRTPSKRVTASGKYFESIPYGLDPVTGLIDYHQLQARAELFRPKVIVCGGSAYPRDWNYAQIRAIADSIGAYVLCDMAHTSGLVLAGKLNNPFLHCDLVTTTTHKTLRGPRGALVFFRKTMPVASLQSQTALQKPYDLADRINASVFPGNQGGPHMNAIAGIAVCLREAMSPAFEDYIERVVVNAKAFAAALKSHGYRVVTDGTDNHLALINVASLGLSGSKVEKAAEKAGIYLNKNSIPGDANAAFPGGVRVGSPCMTSRGMRPDDFVRIAEFLHSALQIALKIQERTGKALASFLPALESDSELAALRASVLEFASKFPLPG
ncbi:MAG: serine hydroxymethyltransferase [archaeon]|nr:serine hydroxymethyltransferase [archaeon]